MSFFNGRIGNVVDEKGAVLGGPNDTAPMNVVFDNVVFHDVIQQGAEVHNECVFSQDPGLTIRNSTFTELRDDGPVHHPRRLVGPAAVRQRHAREQRVRPLSERLRLALLRALLEQRQVRERPRRQQLVRELGGILDNIGTGPYSGVWANNIGGGWSCLPGVTYRNNVGRSCGPSDKADEPRGSVRPAGMRVGRDAAVPVDGSRRRGLPSPRGLARDRRRQPGVRPADRS